MKRHAIFLLSSFTLTFACADGSLDPSDQSPRPGFDSGLTIPDGDPDAGDLDAGGNDASGMTQPESDAGGEPTDSGAGGGADTGQNCGALQLCGSECVDTTIDDAHCGRCGNTCSADELCSAGGCVEGPVPEWEVSFGHNTHSRPRAEIFDIATDEQGRLWLSGLGNNAAYQVAQGSAEGSFVESFDLDGTRRLRHVWPLFFGSVVFMDNVEPVGGDSYVVTGRLSGAYTFDANHYTSESHKGFAAELDSQGSITWLTPLKFDATRGIGVTDDTLYTHFRGEPNPSMLRVGDVTFRTEHGWGRDAFIVALSRSGEVLWGRGDGDQGETGLAVIGDDVVRMSYLQDVSEPTNGYIVDSFDQTGSPIAGYNAANRASNSYWGGLAAGGNAVYTALFQPRLDAVVVQKFVDGEVTWERELPAETVVMSIAADEKGRLYVGGLLSGPASFDAMNYGAERDGFVTAYDTDGSVRWTHFIKPSSATDSVRIPEIEVANSGHVYFLLDRSEEVCDRVAALRQPW